jgi:hypothetical protein
MSHHFRTGRDSKKVKISYGCISREGRDGRVVAIPPGVHRGRVETDAWWQYYTVQLLVKEAMDASYASQRVQHLAKVEMAA